MRCIFIVIIFCILGVRCKTITFLSEKDILGKYEWSSYYDVYSDISLLENHTFEYNWRVGQAGGTTIGCWKKDGSTLILNSNNQPGFHILFTGKSDSTKYKIKLIDDSNTPLIFASCQLYKNKELIIESETNMDGVCILPLVGSEIHIVLSYIGYNKVDIEVQDLRETSFTVVMKEEGSQYKYFTNQRWKIKAGELANPNMERSLQVNNYFEKIETR